ncbi:chitinase 1-like [Oryza brachyantha]|uniref:chitinase 1-like n=1 Tax=Oryza brachyantha TaxID=4533 RepID=UPI0003EAD1DC|nr:chitinase 1-like [Oryza brachyantha]
MADVKLQHPNAQVVLGVGGATVGGVDTYFSPADEDSWVSNAVDSLSGIIDTYQLDGIDIDYEQFNGDEALFARCIGRLLTELKARYPALVTSIAPYKDTEGYYQALWSSYQEVIDYVNYQFYANPASTRVEQYMEEYGRVAGSVFAGGSVLASINTSNPADVVTVDAYTALQACAQLAGNLTGIFVWSADSSYYNNLDFWYEGQAQQILAVGTN